jgi:hypothetical protein
MRSFITAALLGLGVLGTTAVLPQQAQAMGPWHGRYYSHVRYYGGGVVVNPYVAPVYVAPTVIGPTVVAPTVVAPAIAPYASLSVGTYGRWGGPVWYGGYRAGYRGGYYHRR